MVNPFKLLANRRTARGKPATIPRDARRASRSCARCRGKPRRGRARSGRRGTRLSIIDRLPHPHPCPPRFRRPPPPSVGAVALMAAEMREVDAVIRRRLASDVALINQIAQLHRQRRRQAHPADAGAAVRRTRSASPAASASSWRRRSSSSTPRRCCTTTWSTSRRCAAAAQTANALFGNAASVLVGDFVYSRAFQMMVVGEPHARARGAGRRHQRDRRGRGAAVDEHARPRPRGRRLPARDPLQDRQAVRGQRAAGRGARRGRPARSRKPAPPTAARSAPPSSWSTTCSTTKARPSSSARTSATTCAKASRRCRC